MSDKSQSEHRQERRKFVRVSIYAVTRYFCLARNQEIGVQTRLSDISEGGAMLVTFDEGIPIDTEISVSFVLPGPNEEFVSAKAIVRHSGFLEENLFRSGVEFTKLSKAHLEAIRRYVRQKSGL